MARNGGRDKTSRVLAGTSTQYLTGALPHVLRRAPVVLVLGPRGVGKSSVVRHMLSGQAMVLRGDSLHEAASRAVRRRRWSEDILDSERLVIDGPSFLRRRAGVRRLVCALLAERALAGRRTVVIEGHDDSALLLLDAVPVQLRVTLNLRYPKAPGRRRFIRKECAALGLDPHLGASLSIDEPWTWLKVKRALRRLLREQAEGQG